MLWKKMMENFFTAIGNIMRFGYYEPRQYIINHDKKVIYLNNAKVACSSLKTSLFSLNDVQDNDVIHSKVANKSIKNINLTDYKDYFSFTFVRNPFERLVSCYESKYHTDKKHLNKTIEYLRYDDYLFGFLHKDYGFKHFIIKIFFIPECLQDRHFFSQYNLIYNNKKQKLINYIGKYENLNEDYEKIRIKYDLGKLPKFNSSNKKDWMDYYTGITSRLVYIKYKKEIKKFGYEKDYQKLKKYLISKGKW